MRLSARRRTTRLLGTGAALLTAFVVLTGCMKGPSVNDSNGRGAGTSTADRLPITTMVADYDEMLAQMRELITTEAPGGVWSEVKPAQTLGGDKAVAGDDATIAVSPLWGYDLAFPSDADARSALVAALGAIGEAHGFSPVQIYVDRPDEVQAVADDAFGAEYQIGSRLNSTLSYTSGSHPAE